MSLLATQKSPKKSGQTFTHLRSKCNFVVSFGLDWPHIRVINEMLATVAADAVLFSGHDLPTTEYGRSLTFMPYATPVLFFKTRGTLAVSWIYMKE